MMIPIPIDDRHQAFIDEIKNHLAEKQIYTDYLSRYAYGTDASFYRYIPQVVLRAHNESEIQKILALAKKHAVAVTFRASGTSLSGQTSSESVLVLMGDQFLDIEVLDQGAQVKLGPMIIGAYANKILKPYGRKIGPDPASINTARIGGILANNSSGMCCGTKDNSYHTLIDLRVILADGTILDSADKESVTAFRKSHREFLDELTLLSERIQKNPVLADRVRHKYRLKNTTGYGVNALLDYTDPIDILKHIMVGSEGTLGFVSEVTYQTVPDYADKASAFVFFDSLANCCSAVAGLKAEATVDAVELLDGKTIRFVGQEIEGLPPFFYSEFNPNAACLLIETKAENKEKLDHQIDEINRILSIYHYVEHTGFQKDPAITNRYWDVRKGLLPIIAKGRQDGTNVITEDVVFPMDKMVEGVQRLTELFDKHNYPEGMIMGHALEGNLHFVLAPLMNTEAELQQFDGFLQELTDLVALELGGSLKGEHGTGRNIAPFVRKEWGDEIYQIMRDLKKLFDPDTILNPEVIISSNEKIHIESIKSIPATDKVVNACMECGFCEPACPSDGLSLTPRQRISIYRNMDHLKHYCKEPEFYVELYKGFHHKGIETCAETGMCSLRCPVGINTGDFIKSLRPKNKKISVKFAAKHFAVAEKSARLGLKMAEVLGPTRTYNVTKKLHSIFKSIPIVPESMPKVTKKPFMPAMNNDKQQGKGATVVYFVSCVNRNLSEINDAHTNTVDHTLSLFKKAGITAVFPEEMNVLCCGQPFESARADQEGKAMLVSLNNALLTASNQGEIPIYVDNAPCSLRVKEAKAKGLIDERLMIYDAAEFLSERVMPKLELTRKVSEIMLHIPCSTTKSNSGEALTTLVKACSEQLHFTNIDCCGFAGNKGFTLPEINANSLRNLKSSLSSGCQYGVSMSKTCQIGLSTHGGIDFQSIEALLDQCSEVSH